MYDCHCTVKIHSITAYVLVLILWKAFKNKINDMDSHCIKLTTSKTVDSQQN